MAQDTLGKKTHLPQVLNLFSQADRVWGARKRHELTAAAHVLEANTGYNRTFQRRGWPHDERATQAYVHRFFQWLELSASDRSNLPILALSTADSVAFRQCLWLDFVFGTPEAQRAIQGLYAALLSSSTGTFEISPRTHNVFCGWVDIPVTDNTRRGPFARWLEDVGLGYALPGRAANETSVIAALADSETIATEALVYGLFVEFAQPYMNGVHSIELRPGSIADSLTVKALLLKAAAVPSMLEEGVKRKYLSRTTHGYGIDPAKFTDVLRTTGPFPALAWVERDATPERPLSQETMEKLRDFPEDDCTATTGEPFDSEPELESVPRHRRTEAFDARVGDAYRHTCAISGLAFRSPTAQVWHGHAAHIVPHVGRQRKSGSPVYGKPVVANGIFMSAFHHWCFDQGWLALRPRKRKSNLLGYEVMVASVAVDEVFKPENKVIYKLEGEVIGPDRLPENPDHWPSIRALEWHRANVFDG